MLKYSKVNLKKSHPFEHIDKFSFDNTLLKSLNKVNRLRCYHCQNTLMPLYKIVQYHI